MGAVVFVSAGCYSQPVQPVQEPLSASADEELESEEDEEDGFPEDLVLLPENAGLPVSTFNEIWAYLVADREDALNLNFPITDLVYFGAELDSYGKLVDVPNYRKISNFRGRKHLVAASNGRALTHFALAEGSPERRALVRDLLEASKPYHGLQIDFEYVPARDGEAFLSFLKELREGLGNKVFSIALQARTRTLQNDVYDYAKILPIVDRILVMAYDEHWSTSAPGPIASMGWCQRVARYALDTIGSEKLIMGLPFYGRSWGDKTPNRAYIFSGIEGIVREQGIREINRENGIPTFKYETPLSITVFYEDAYSLSARLEMYKKMGVGSVGFWRLGQETPAFWPVIGLE
jgi:spore germination protein YaaH